MILAQAVMLMGVRSKLIERITLHVQHAHKPRSASIVLTAMLTSRARAPDLHSHVWIAGVDLALKFSAVLAVLEPRRQWAQRSNVIDADSTRRASVRARAHTHAHSARHSNP